MARRLEGKRVLLTGGVANIGLEVAKHFIAEGAKVAIVDVDETRGAQAVHQLGEGSSFFGADIAQEEQVCSVVPAATDWLGGLDVLCLNAGVQRSGEVAEFTQRQLSYRR